MSFPPNAYPCLIGIFCDQCGEAEEHDYLVHEDWTQEQRFACARRHLNTVGWRCDESGDFCPEHAAASPAGQAETDEREQG